MTRIELTTDIRAPREVCFDLARDLDLHLRSMAHSGEQAVAGRTTGLIGLGEEVTWRARHFGIRHHHTSRITAFDRPACFRDSMVAGRFRVFEHDHLFDAIDGGTRMRDIVIFESPLGILGRCVDRLVLVQYLTRLLKERNRVVQTEAERGQGGGAKTSDAPFEVGLGAGEEPCRLYFGDLEVGQVRETAGDFPSMFGHWSAPPRPSSRVAVQIQRYVDYSIEAGRLFDATGGDERWQTFVATREPEFAGLIGSDDWWLVGRDGTRRRIVIPNFLPNGGVVWRYKVSERG